ncbi:MAG: hypothetical protein WAV09_02485 [Minisyncoccia bacterium]
MNMSVGEAIAVGKRYQTASDEEVVVGHRALNEFVDQVQSGKHCGVLHDDLQNAKAWKALLKLEKLSRGLLVERKTPDNHSHTQASW